MPTQEGRVAELKKLLRLNIRPARPSGDKNAGVLILLDYFQDDYQVLLCVRSENLRRHPGEVCYPGGMYDEDDGHLQNTALREAEEEVGITRKDYYILGCLPPFRSRFDVIIQPTIALVKRPLNIRLNSHEVARFFWKPLASFLHDQDHSSYDIDERYAVHSFHFPEAHTYGVTALMCIVVAMGVLQLRPQFDVTPQITEVVMRGISVDAAIDAVYSSASLPFRTNNAKL